MIVTDRHALGSEQASHRFVAWAWAFGLVVFAVLAVLASDLDPAVRETVSRSGLAFAGIAAAISCGARAVRSTGRRRRAWGLLSAGGTVGLVGNLYSALLGDPTAGDAAYILALLLGIVGVASFPVVRPRGAELVRMLLDGVVVGGSLLYVALFAVFPGVLTDGGTGFERFTALALPVVDSVLATLAVLLITRSSRAERVPLVLVGAGFVLYALADLAFAILNAEGSFAFGSPVDIAWVGGYLAIALAARHPAASGSPLREQRDAASPVAGTIVTFALFLAAALVRVSQVQDNALSLASTILWLLVLATVAARQILLVVDNEALRQGLERRVQERTSQLHALARERERTLESVADGIYGVDADGRITFMNDAGARTLGYAPTDLVGVVAHEVVHAKRADGTSYPIAECYITEAVHEGITATAEEDTYLRADGKEVPVEVTASPLRGDGVIHGAVVVFRDVTQRREVDRLKDEFVSVVSHELRTPLTSIRGALGLLHGGALGTLPDQATRMVDIALDSSERLGRLIDDILDIERMDAGTSPLDVTDQDVAALVESALTQVRVVAEEADVEVRVIPTDARVRADADRIVQTLINLLANAVKFSDAGSVVHVSCRSTGELVEVRVDDEGRGIPPEMLEPVFGRFEQVDASDARERGGTGLGLAISRSIVERHGGRIWAHSDGVGTGSSFFFTLPRATSPAPASGASRPGDDEESVPGAETTSGTFVSAPTRPVAQAGPVAHDHTDAEPVDGATVLVCDDDPFVVAVLGAVLEERGYTVIGVTDGDDALRAVGELHPDAVVLDLIMPGSSGAEVLAALRGHPATADVPVIVVSGLRPSDDGASAALANGWLVKPVEPADLTAAVRSVIHDHEHHDVVLVVEDDLSLAQVMTATLENSGLEVIHADSITSARRVVADHTPGVLVLDLNLPDGRGDELVAELRHDGRLQALPLVVYSALEVDDDARDELRLGETVFLTKGRASPDLLLERVLTLLDQASGHRAGARSVPDHPRTGEILTGSKPPTTVRPPDVDENSTERTP
ncbi:response regulator [Oerskovia flava]|uniref:response regulator n=1 Tax=Oerskovia flava TaxID=2986422 RepID=UPI00223FC3DE|nr:response regulator [Oerskovia sp. JB1-3-2]